MNAYGNELRHHGILGQKWGKRQGPPYPLDASKHSAREKKMGWRKSLEKDAVKGKRKVAALFVMPVSSDSVKSYSQAIKHRVEGRKGLNAPSGKYSSDKTSSKKQLKVLSSPNEVSELHQTKLGFFGRFLGAVSPSIKEKQSRFSDYVIHTKDGTNVGNLSTYIEDDGITLNGIWLDVKPKYGGRGYAQSAMRLAINDARQQGLKYFTLEVPTNSPNARHIYEKLGFEDTGEPMLGDSDDFWGGLTKMRLKL